MKYNMYPNYIEVANIKDISNYDIIIYKKDFLENN